MSKAGLEERLAKVEGVLEQVDKRLNHIEGDLTDLRADIRSLDGKVDRNFTTLDGKIDRNFKWTLGILIPMWITIILAIVFK